MTSPGIDSALLVRKMMRAAILLNQFALALLVLLGGQITSQAQALPDAAVRQQLIEAVLSEGEDQPEQIEALAETGSDMVATVLAQWRAGNLLVDAGPDGAKVLFTKEGADAVRLDTGVKFTPVTPKEVETTSKTRKAIKNALDLIAVASPDPKLRSAAIGKLGMTQNTDYLPMLEARQAKETDAGVKKALVEAISVMQLADEDDVVCIAAVQKLGEMRSLASLDLLKAMVTSGCPHVLYGLGWSGIFLRNMKMPTAPNKYAIQVIKTNMSASISKEPVRMNTEVQPAWSHSALPGVLYRGCVFPVQGENTLSQPMA